MHAGLEWLDGEKMSKSLGNLVFARDALRDHGADAVRWYLLSQHYREELDYRRNDVERYVMMAQQLQEAVRAQGGGGAPLDLSEAARALDAAMADDLNTPLAFSLLHDMANDTLAAAAEGRDVEAATATVRELATMLGFRLGE
jgi:L-cysteine:1D-myo-inositol 2-amino-2-deoxy-alpha-D-glucopyranoside ligase